MSAVLARIADPVAAPRSATFVYFVERDGLVKIGCSCDPARRARELGGELRAAMPGSFQSERAVHVALRASRVHGEWFAPSDELDALIKAVGLPARWWPRSLWGPEQYEQAIGEIAQRYATAVESVERLTLICDAAPVAIELAYEAAVSATHERLALTLLAEECFCRTGVGVDLDALGRRAAG